MGTKQFEMTCAWCGRLTGWTTIDKSHGMCANCFKRLTGVPDLTEEQLNELPYGAIKIDKIGKILCYNKTEEDAVLMRSEKIIGRNFFTEIAPCTAVKDFQGRFEEFFGKRRD